MSNFVLTGAAGYIAPKHLEAIKETGNNLLAVVDPSDSVGVLDKYFPEVQYFREFERFDRHVDLLIRSGVKIDYLSVCSPNYLHDAHCRFGLRVGADVICEKPLVIKSRNLDALQEDERVSGRRIYTILQTRLHPEIVRLKQSLSDVRRKAPSPESTEWSKPQKSEHEVSVCYHTYRGPWYQYSWKGDTEKSGGLLMNIGVHLMDLFTWLFGRVYGYVVETDSPEHSQGQLWFMDAHVRWDLCLDCRDVKRALSVDGRSIDLTSGFDALHVKSYQEILSGRGFGIDDVRPSIELVDELSNVGPVWMGSHRGD